MTNLPFNFFFMCRMERVEFLDEQELLFQLLHHYTLSCGYSDHTHIGRFTQHAYFLSCSCIHEMTKGSLLDNCNGKKLNLLMY